MKFREYRKLLAAVTISAMLATLPGASVLAAPAASINLFPATKNETVYVKTDESGQAKKIIVSDQLQNVRDEKNVKDFSTLTGIENVKGEETFTQKGDKLTWKSSGDDIVYQGESDKELPVGVAITYELDGKEISPKDLIGKSGHLKVSYHYSNDKSRTGGQYTPFLMVTATVLDHEHFRNVKVGDGGHFESDGQNMTVVGYSIPGMLDYLGIDRDDAPFGAGLTISDDFSFEADVDEYKAPTCGTVATNELFADLNMGDSIDSLDELKSSLNKLADSSAQLVTGSSVLAGGLYELESNVPALKDGTGKLATGSSKLSDGTDTLAKGAGKLDSGIGQMQKKVNSSMPALKTGTGQLATGAGQLASGIDQAAKGASALTEGLNTLHENIAAIAAGAAQVNEGVSSVSDGAEGVASGAAQLADGMSQVQSSVDQLSALAGTIDTSGLSEADQAKLQQVIGGLNQVSGTLGAQGSVGGAAAQVSSGASQVSTGASDLKTGASQVSDGASQLSQATGSDSELVQGASQLASALSSEGAIGTGATQLSSGLGTLNQSVGTMSGTLTNALGQLADGSAELSDGASSINSGARQLKNGIGSLNSKIPALSSGIGELSSGASQLSEGMARFDTEGIDKLVSYMDGDVAGLLEKANDMLANSQRYNNYSGITKDMNGTVKFVFVADEEE